MTTIQLINDRILQLKKEVERLRELEFDSWHRNQNAESIEREIKLHQCNLALLLKNESKINKQLKIKNK